MFNAEAAMSSSLPLLLPLLILGQPHVPPEPLPAGALLRLGTNQWRHKGDVGSVAVPANAQLVAAADAESVRLWDVSGSGPPQTLVGEQSFSGPLAFSADGKTLAGTRANRVVLWDTTTKTLHRFADGHASRITCLAFSPDGKTVAAGDLDRTIRLWDTKTGKERLRLNGHDTVLSAVVFVPGSRILVSADHDGTVCFWDADTGKRLKELPKSKLEEVALRLAVSHDGTLLAVAGAPRTWGSDSRAAVRVLEIATGKERFQVPMKHQFAQALAFAPDGKTLAGGIRLMGGSGFSPIHLWDAATGKLLGSLRGHAGVTGVFFTPDGHTLISSGYDGAIRFWNVADGGERSDFHGHTWPISAVAYSPDGQLLATGSSDWTIGIWNATTGKRLHIVAQHYDAPRQLLFTPDSQYLLSAAWCDRGGQTTDTVAFLWNVETGALVRSFHGISGGIALSPDGRLLAHAAGCEGRIQLVDLATGEERGELAGHDGLVNALSFSRDGRLLASVGNDGVLQLWRLKSKRLAMRLPLREAAKVVAFSPDGRLVLAGCDDGKIHVFEAATGLYVAWVNAGAPGIQQIHFGGAGRALLLTRPYDPTSRQLRAGVFDLAGCRYVRPLTGNGEPCAAAVAPDGRTVTLGYRDGTLLVWPAATWLQLPPLPARPLSPGQFDRSWPVLAGLDGRAANDIHWLLVAGGEATVAWLRARLRPVPHRDAKVFAQRLAELDSDKYQVRNQAMLALEQWGDVAEVPLRKALGRKPSLEARQRIEKLLAAIDALAVDSETLRLLRAIAILQAIGTEPARQVLQDLAQGAPGARVTEAARTALARGLQ
jgi:WD40 repeat protein